MINCNASAEELSCSSSPFSCPHTALHLAPPSLSLLLAPLNFLHDSCYNALSQKYTHLPLQVAGRTNDAAGDGTTTASVLAREMIHFGLQAVSAGANPVAVKKGLDKTCAFLVNKLRENATQISGTKDIKVGCA